MNNVLKHFISDRWSNSKTGRCRQCGRDLYNPDAEFCTINCEKVYKQNKQYLQEEKDFLPGQ